MQILRDINPSRNPTLLYAFIKRVYLKTKNIRFNESIIFGLVSVCAFWVYFTTAARYPVGFADSDELITTGYLLGVPHPSGYPLFNLLVFIATHLPISPNIALKAHLLSSLLQAVTVGLIFLASLQLLHIYTKQTVHTCTAYVSAIISAFTLAFSFLFWTFANVVEVFSLNNLITAMYLYLTLYVFDKPYLKKRSLFWISIGILSGVALSHHQTVLFLLPGIIILLLPDLSNAREVFRNTKNYGYSLLAFGMTFIAANSLLLLYRAKNAALSWNFDNSFSGLLGHILRQDYAKIKAAGGIITGVYFTGLYIPENAKALFRYLSFVLPDHWGFAALFLLSIGIIAFAVRRHSNRLKAGLLFTYFLTGPALAFYITLPDPSVSPSYRYMVLGITERMYLMGYVILALFLTIGLYEGILFLKHKLSQIPGYVIYSTSFFIPLMLLITNYNGVNLRSYNSVYEYAKLSLQGVEPAATIICLSDISCFSLAYVQSIDHIREDVTVIPVTKQMQKFVIEKYPGLYDPSTKQITLTRVLATSLQNKNPVYLAEVNERYIDRLYLDDIFFLQPGKTLHRITCSPNITDSNITDISKILHNPSTLPDRRQYLQWAFRGMLSEQQARNGVLYARANQKQEALALFNNADAILPNEREITILKENLGVYQGDDRYKENTQCKDAEYFLARAKKCQTADTKCIYTELVKATLVNPSNVEARLWLAKIYEEAEIFDLAIFEYETVLKDSPGDSIIKDKLMILKEQTLHD